MIDDRLGEGDALSVEERDGTTATMMSTRSMGAASRAPSAARRRFASTRASAGRARTVTRAGGEGKETPFTNADAFSALSGLKKTGADPFASGAARARPMEAERAVGFVKSGVDATKLPSTRDSDAILKRFDDTQRREGTEAAVTACERPAMERSTRALASRASRVMLGICAPSAEDGLASLKTWTAELGLPKGKLHGMDRDGVPVDPPKGAVFIKYNSLSGDAYISGYGGTFRGVLFTPELEDAAFRQYGYLPLDVLTGH